MKLKELESILESDGIVFLNYGGFLTHSLIVGMTDALEKESENNDMSLKVTNNILTIFIELSQNMMNYSKKLSSEGSELDPTGLIMVGVNKNKSEYYIFSRNILNSSDKEKILPKIKEVQSLDKVSLKELYRKNRKSGLNKHEKGAGLGFIEIARKCDKINFSFDKIENKTDLYYFSLKATIDNH